MTTAMFCAHHWDIEPSAGHVSHAKCLKCGETSEFLNSVDEEYHFEVAHSRREVEMAKLSGAGITSRAKALKGARKKAESLLRDGVMAREVQAQLRPDFGEIAVSTIQGWKTRMAKMTHKPKKEKAAPPEPGIGDDERLWQMVMDAKPDWKDKPRLGRWMDMIDAVYAFLVEC